MHNKSSYQYFDWKNIQYKDSPKAITWYLVSEMAVFLLIELKKKSGVGSMVGFVSEVKSWPLSDLIYAQMIVGDNPVSLH